jgi:putative NADH-flavin reductase
MKIALIGASGNVGSRIVTEALLRGHRVTGIARHVDAISPRPGLTPAAGDISNPDNLALVLAGHDCVVSSVRFVAFDLGRLLQALELAGAPRLLMVGGAGSLRTAPAVMLVDTPGFPEPFKAEARAGAETLRLLQEQNVVDWTFLSPSAVFTPGVRTSHFRRGRDELLLDAEGKSRISQEDYAVAMLDEIEAPRHRRQRFTVGY